MESMLYKENNDIILLYNNTLSAVRTTNAKGFVYGRPGRDGFYPLQNEELGWVTAVPPKTSRARAAPGSSSGSWSPSSW